MGLGAKTWNAPTQQDMALKRQRFQLQQSIEYQRERRKDEEELFVEVADLQRRAQQENLRADRRFQTQIARQGFARPMMPPMAGAGLPMMPRPMGVPMGGMPLARPPMAPMVNRGSYDAIGRLGLSGVGTRDYGRRAMLQQQQVELRALDEAVVHQRQENMILRRREQMEAAAAERDRFERARVVEETVRRASELEQERMHGMQLEAQRRRAQARREQADQAQRIQESHLLAAASGHRRGASMGSLPQSTPLSLPRPPTATPQQRPSHLSPYSAHEHELSSEHGAHLFPSSQARPRTISGPSRLDALRDPDIAAQHRAEAARLQRELNDQDARLSQLEHQLDAARSHGGQQSSPPFGADRSPRMPAYDHFPAAGPSQVSAGTPRTSSFPIPRFRDDLAVPGDPRHQIYHPDREASYPVQSRSGHAATHGTPTVRFENAPIDDLGQYTPPRQRPASFHGPSPAARYLPSPALF